MNKDGYILLDGLILILITGLFLTFINPLIGSIAKVDLKNKEDFKFFKDYDGIIEYLKIAKDSDEEIYYGNINFTKLINHFKERELVIEKFETGEGNNCRLEKVGLGDELWEIEITLYNDKKEFRDKIYLLK